MQEKKLENGKMSFKDYYKSLSELQLEMRSRIIERFGISEKTFYNKTNDESWSEEQLVVIEEVKAEITREISELC